MRNKIVFALTFLIIIFASLAYAINLPPQLNVSSDKTLVKINDNLTITASASDDDGMAGLRIGYDGNYNYKNCTGITCAKSWILTYSLAGILHYDIWAYDIPGSVMKKGIDINWVECYNSENENRQCGATDIGECKHGLETRTCSAYNWDLWSACVGEVGPTSELCDSLDNDCDGTVDNGFTAICSIDLDCNDGIPATFDKCVNPGDVCNAYCENTICEDIDNDLVCDNVDSCIGENQTNVPPDTACADHYFNSGTGCHEVFYYPYGANAGPADCDYLDTTCRDYNDVIDTCDGFGGIIPGVCNDFVNAPSSTLCYFGPNQTSYQCANGTTHGSDVFFVTNQTQQYCGLNTGFCDGTVNDFVSYEVYDNCIWNEYCVEGNDTCVFDPDVDGDGYNYTVDCADNNPDIWINVVVYADFDYDTYTLNIPYTFCTNGSSPSDAYTFIYNPDDCNDFDALINPGAIEIPGDNRDQNCDYKEICYLDFDNDAYLHDPVQTINSSDPDCYDAGEGDNNNPLGDCDDNNSLANPSMTEIIYNGFDDDCNALTLDDDLDQDGYILSNDCNDNDASINPGAAEVCDNVDNDCIVATSDGSDESWLYQPTTCGLGECSSSGQLECTLGLQTDTCSSGTPTAEVCDNLDNDCDGSVDEELIAPLADMQAGVCENSTKGCAGVSGWVEPDYNLISGYENPETTCDSLDNDCDALVDEGITNTYYFDFDLDLFGNLTNTIQECSLPTGYVIDSTDCDDSDAQVNPGEIETPYNGVDDDCNALTLDDDLDQDGYGHLVDCDDNNAGVWANVTAYLDFDGDTWTVGIGQVFCTNGSVPVSYTLTNNPADCNDNDASINPGAAEVCDGADNDCNAGTSDGISETWYGNLCDGADTDLCQEGTLACSGGVQTCTDTSSNNLDLCDGLDNDCNAATSDGSDESWLYQPTTCGLGECSSSGQLECTLGLQTDTCSSGTPTAEVCDNLDNDCDGSVDEELIAPLADMQAGVCENSTKVCGGVGGWTEPDYNLVFGYENPETTCDSLDNDCDAVVDEGLANIYYLDFDLDLFGNATVSTQACTAPTNYVADNTDCNDNNAFINPNATEIPNNGVDEDCDGSDLVLSDIGINITFFRFSTGVFENMTEACWYKNCWYDKTLSFNTGWFMLNATTDVNAGACRAELVEYDNDYTQNDYSFFMSGGPKDWGLNASGVLPGLYNLTVYCNDTFNTYTSSQTFWSTNNTNPNPYHTESYYNESDTSFVFLSQPVSIEGFTATPNIVNQRLITINATIKGLKTYNNISDVFGTFHYYIDLKGRNNSNITSKPMFLDSNSTEVYDFRYEGIDSNTTLWSFNVIGIKINSTHYNWFDYPMWNGSDMILPYYGFAARMLDDAGIPFYDSNDTAWSRRAIVDHNIDTHSFVNIEPTKYNGSSLHTFYDGDLAKHYFSFTNTGEAVNDYYVRIYDYRANLTEEIYFYDVPSNQTVYYENNFTIQANCSAAGVPSNYCPTDPTTRYYSYTVFVDTTKNIATSGRGSAYNDLGVYKAYTFSDHVNISYLPSSSLNSDYLKLRTDIIGANGAGGLKWFGYKVDWALSPPWTIGALVINNTASADETGVVQNYPQEFEDYYCGNSSNCFIPIVDGEGGNFYHHYWNFKSVECDKFGTGISRYIFNVTAGNHPHDQIRFSVTQDDDCW